MHPFEIFSDWQIKKEYNQKNLKKLKLNNRFLQRKVSTCSGILLKLFYIFHFWYIQLWVLVIKVWFEIDCKILLEKKKIKKIKSEIFSIFLLGKMYKFPLFWLWISFKNCTSCTTLSINFYFFPNLYFLFLG